MTQVQIGPVSPGRTRPEARPRWPLWATAAGLLGAGATVLAGQDGQPLRDVGASLALGAALLLVVTSACWRRFVEPRTRSSTAAHVVPLALLVSAAGLALGHADDLGGWVGVMAAAAALAWMAWRERSVSRPVGVLAALAVVGVPVAPAVLGPLWLLAVGLGLAFGRSTISR